MRRNEITLKKNRVQCLIYIEDEQEDIQRHQTDQTMVQYKSRNASKLLEKPTKLYVFKCNFLIYLLTNMQK